MDGLIVVDKPGGCTSHDIVLRIRRILNNPKAGHCGTLDPDATGVLLVAVGRAVRFFPYLSRQEKSYEGLIRFGFSTDTYDASGRPTSAESREYPSKPDLLEAMGKWEGEVLQVPPAYSAKKVEGQPMHRRARAGQDVRPNPVPVFVREFHLLDYTPPSAQCRIVCASGTYIRSLAHDLGQDLGCGAHLENLRRTAVGPYSIQGAWTLAEIEEESEHGGSSKFLIPLKDLLPEVPLVTLSPDDESRVRNGIALPVGTGFKTIPQGDAGGNPPLLRLCGSSGEFVGLARLAPGEDRFIPFLVIPPSS